MKRSISDAIRMTVIFKEALPDDGPNQSAILKPIGRVEWQDDPRGTITKLIVHGENDQRELYPLE